MNLTQLVSRRSFLLALLAATLLPALGADPKKPALLYSRRFNAVGENRYLPDGAYKDVMARLGKEFKVTVNDLPLTPANLARVKVLLVANPSDKAAGTNPPPHHISAEDVKNLTEFVRKGGGLIFMSNQVEAHNLETADANQLLAQFGLQTANVITDAKKLALPKETPLLGGLNWAYYTGNQIRIEGKSKAKPRAVVVNDLAQKPAKGTNDHPGILLAVSELGKGRVVVATDSGWIADWAFSEEGIGGVALKGQDNWEIFRRLAHWAAGTGK